MDTTMNFTIIIPHKNIPKLLARLIKSIPERDDLEIIVVDDHSNENIVDFGNFPGKDRLNFRFLSNEGEHGAGHARNYALPYATGKWVLFADSDDFYNKGFDKFLNDYVYSEADIIFFNANSVDTDTYESSNRANHLNEFINEYETDPKRGELIMRHMFTEPWCKMIRRSVIVNHSVKFDDTSIHEDVKFSCLIGLYANKIVVDNRQLYCITTRTNSLSRTQTLKTYLDELMVFSWWKKYLIDNQIPLELPKFDYRAYNFARHLYKDNKLFRAEFRMMRRAGLSLSYIIRQIMKYLCKSVVYKINNLF
jgi:glycosyltransferase involved in cell wall biosynthesis